MNYDELVGLLIFYLNIDEDIEKVYLQLDRDPPTEEDKIRFFKDLPISYVKCRLDKVFGNITKCHKCMWYSCIFDECILKTQGLGCVQISQSKMDKESY